MLCCAVRYGAVRCGAVCAVRTNDVLRYKCTAVSQINARLQLKQAVALKEIYAMEMIGDKVGWLVGWLVGLRLVDKRVTENGHDAL